MLTAYRFFRKQGEPASRALQLAKAEVFAHEAGWRFRWLPDYDDQSWCDAKLPKPEFCEWCQLLDEDGDRLASLSGIWDASTEYRRWVEAELALEVKRERERNLEEFWLNA